TEEQPEEYQQPDALPMQTEHLIAAHTLYPYVRGFDDRIRRVRTAYDLIQIVASRVYMNRVADDTVKAEMKAAVNGMDHMKRAFQRVLFHYHLALTERKIR
ncbi:hypothetical protein ACFL0V_07460, partial [Nanoarchaeota archaeon]